MTAQLGLIKMNDSSVGANGNSSLCGYEKIRQSSRPSSSKARNLPNSPGSNQLNGPYSLIRDVSLASVVPSSSVQTRGSSELLPHIDANNNAQIRLERRAHLERLSTPSTRKTPRRSQSMASLLGDKDAFAPNVYLKKSAALHASLSTTDGPPSRDGSPTSNVNGGGRLSPEGFLNTSSMHSNFTHHSHTSRSTRGTKGTIKVTPTTEIADKTNSQPLMSLFNEYKRKKSKRTDEQVELLR